MKKKAPWLKFYDGISKKIDYPDTTISKAVLDVAEKYPQNTALVYFGRKISYHEFMNKVLYTRQRLENMGIKAGDRIIVCLPNIPQAVYLLYAADSLGAVCSFVHPLSAPEELAYYIKTLDAVCVAALDSMKNIFEKISGERLLILTNVLDEAGGIYKLKGKAKKSFEKKATPCQNETKAEDTAVILFSGGTTGTPKGVMLSGRSLNIMAMQTAFVSGWEIKGKSMLAVMPLFHGFGLCVCVHAVLLQGGTSILVPRFSPRTYARLIKKHRPNFIAGVPTLFEALLKEPLMHKLDLSCLMGVFSGGDALPARLKEDFDEYLYRHKAKVRIREGYGLTECVTASCLTPRDVEKKGSVGIPFPDTYYKICRVGTTEEVPGGTQGEICICGPTIMQGYLNAPQETQRALRQHRDGEVWLHTGDLGVMDEEGFVYFKRRLGRMIVTSGYNVYPEQLEQLLDSHPKVFRSCVVGVDDAYKIRRIKAYIVPKSKSVNTEDLLTELKAYCGANVARYAVPSEFVLTSALPLTKYGKVDYRQLEKTHADFAG